MKPKEIKFDRVWYWLTKFPERKGQKCRVLARGKMNSQLIEFEDGFRAIVSRNATRKIKDGTGST